jgi:hypothetical protein
LGCFDLQDTARDLARNHDQDAGFGSPYLNTRPYPLGVRMTEEPDVFGEARSSIRTTTRDPVTKLLLGSSHLTVAQLETLLADSVSYEKAVNKGRRRLFRPSGRRISRGSYNRTLFQAQNNVIRSIYTILLLGYVGLFDTSALQPFIELSDNLQGYIQETSIASSKGSPGIEELKKKLEETISALAKRASFKDVA